MKLVMTASVAFLHPCHNWGKPLNPILGETYQASLPDGSQIFVEQVCHHPPISYLLLEGPNNSYRFYGYSIFAIKAYLNSINLEISGHKVAEFADGSKIVFNNQQDTFGNTLIGTCHHQMLGKIKFEDLQNGITGYLNLGDEKRRPRDYFSGHIEQHGIVVCEKIYGNYMGYADFDNERYLDIREQENYKITDIPLDSPTCLDSEARKRSDLRELFAGNDELAQDNKTALEVAQRHDRKLRETAAKRRENGGPKIVYHWEK